MAGSDDALIAHAKAGLTTLCHAWLITRADGAEFAFTDHDVPLNFGGYRFLANSGLSARALAQTTGLSVDNSEAIGALSDASIREDEIEQGRFDGADVRAWLVNWADTSERTLQFRGTIGELRRTDGAFHAELRGLAEALNRPLGRVFQKPCSAVLGDRNCGFDLALNGYSETLEVQEQTGGQKYRWVGFEGYDDGWFARGRMEILDGPASGLWEMVKHDRRDGNFRIIELWQPIRGAVGAGTKVRLVAGCDKRMETCRLKFNNFVNYQGFPDLPGEDWAMAVPRSGKPNSGGSLR